MTVSFNNKHKRKPVTAEKISLLLINQYRILSMMASSLTYWYLEERRGFQMKYLVLFDGHMKKILRVFLCNCIYIQAALAFLAYSSVAGLGSQSIMIYKNASSSKALRNEL